MQSIPTVDQSFILSATSILVPTPSVVRARAEDPKSIRPAKCPTLPSIVCLPLLLNVRFLIRALIAVASRSISTPASLYAFRVNYIPTKAEIHHVTPGPIGDRPAAGPQRRYLPHLIPARLS